MLYLATFLIFIGAVKASLSSFQQFNAIKQLSDMENNIDPLELFNRKALQSNKILECDLQDIYEVVGLNELQDLIEAIATRKGISPFAVLRMLHKRMKNKEEIEESIANSIDGLPLPDHLSPPILDILPPPRMPPVASLAPYSLSSSDQMDGDEETKVVIIPVAPPVTAQNNALNRFPGIIKPELTSRNEGPFVVSNMEPPTGKSGHVLPAVFPLLSPIRNNHLRPPIGATIRINTNDPRNPMNRDIMVTLSPLMSLLEALRQAEIKYQNILGLDHNMEVISFSHSSSINCFVVDSITNLAKNDKWGWKITIADQESQVVYDDFCLPNGKEALIKPGSLISLSYVPL